MILSFLLLLQVAAGPDSIHVQGAAREGMVPVRQRSGMPMVRADLLVSPLGGAVRQAADGHYVVAVPGAELELSDGVPFAAVGDDVIPLSSAPAADSGRLWLPLQLVTDVVPRVGSGVIYDPARAELRVFQGMPRRPGDAVASAPGRSARSPRRDPPATATTTALPGNPGTARSPRASRRRLIVVDAGHGGPDNGMTGPIGGGPRMYEKNVTLAVARLVAAELQSLGFQTVMTRTSDTLIGLYDRGRIANQLHGDVFVSIHVNAANLAWRDPGAARGYETYFLSEAKTEDESRVERMENEAVRFETGANAAKGDPLSYIINDMAQNEHLRESDDLAATIQQQLGVVHPGPSRGVKQANFAVLRTSFMPAVLVEIGFGTNPAEAEYLTDSDGQRRIARAVASGVAEYVAHYERRVGGAP